MPLRPSIARAARAYTGLTHVKLAQAAGVASRTIHKLEKDGNVTEQSLERILDALSRLGVTVMRKADGSAHGLLFEESGSKQTNR